MGKKPTGTLEEMYEAILNFDEDGFTAAPPPKPFPVLNPFAPQRGEIARDIQEKAAIVKAWEKLKRLAGAYLRKE